MVILYTRFDLTIEFKNGLVDTNIGIKISFEFLFNFQFNKKLKRPWMDIISLKRSISPFLNNLIFFFFFLIY